MKAVFSILTKPRVSRRKKKKEKKNNKIPEALINIAKYKTGRKKRPKLNRYTTKQTVTLKTLVGILSGIPIT